ncbi:MAG: hypothetical protein PVI63_09960 [Anaerolineae bacterium]|jgi:hypothetical protein
MNEKLTPIYVARQLRQRDLFYFTPSLLADLFRLDRRRAYGLIARLKDKALITEVEKGKYLLFRFVTIKPSKLFGYQREMVGDLPTIVADEAKAIVDSLDLPDYAGGLGEIAKALRAALETVDVDTLVQYANRMEDKSLGSRLGYLLETLDQPAEGLIRSASPVKLDVSSSHSGETDPRWQVIVNVPERSLIPQGVG